MSAQTQSWQWVKGGGSSSDYGSTSVPAICKIGGCDARGNVYAAGMINGDNVIFDTFTSPGGHSQRTNYLMFSYDCAGHMRWAKQIGDEEGDPPLFGITTDPQGNTYLAAALYYGYNGGIVRLFLGDSVINPIAPVITQPYLCMVKYDSLGKLIWFKNFQEDTAYNPHVGSFQTFPYGLRIGSSGHLWMACSLDSNYSISPNLHTTKKGRYNVEVDPISGNILSGYYLAQEKIFGNSDDADTYWDLDKDENFYETGTLVGDFGSGGDTLILATQRIAPDTSQTYSKPYIYSLDKHGNFRYIISNINSVFNGNFKSCKYDYQSNRLIACWGLNNGDIYGSDTFRFVSQNIPSGQSRGLFAINPNGNILWGKYLTKDNGNLGFIFWHQPTPFYSDHEQNNGLLIYNNSDTLFNKDSTASIYDYTKIVSRIDKDGKMIATHSAHVGNVGSFRGDNMIRYGATDWRGNVYLGGTVTNYFATPADSVINTDLQSGNFFIAKLGTSDCSCPTPGTQFTQTAKGDTINFFGTSINHRDSIHWRFGDGTTSNKDTITHVYTHTGTYTVTAIAYSACGLDSITKQINITTGIVSIDTDKTNLYPNPVKNTVNLEVSGAAMIGLVYANGATVWDRPLQVNQSGTYVFDMSKYASAMYYFIVQYTSGKTDLLKVVKE
jgi:PKD repeat protein